MRTPGRNRNGYVVFMAYKMVDSVSFSNVSFGIFSSFQGFVQIMLESVMFNVDIEAKKKAILHLMGDLKLSPPVDDR